MSLPGTSAKLVAIYVDSLQSDLVAGLPVGMFVAQAEAIDLVNTYDSDWLYEPDRFNIHRFKNLTYRIKLGRSWWYYKPSVEAYAKTGDGRISLIGN